MTEQAYGPPAYNIAIRNRHVHVRRILEGTPLCPPTWDIMIESHAPVISPTLHRAPSITAWWQLLTNSRKSVYCLVLGDCLAKTPLLFPGLHSDLSLSSLDGDDAETLRRGALAAACADAVAAYATLEGSRVRDSIAAHARRALERERQIDEKNDVIADLSSKVRPSYPEKNDRHISSKKQIDFTGVFNETRGLKRSHFAAEFPAVDQQFI